MVVPDSAAAIDQRLVEIGDVVERMGSVLVDLEANPARVLLPTAPLTGSTATAWAETECLVAVLWQLYPVATQALDRMTVERGTRPTLDGGERSHLAAALAGPCLTLEPELASSIRQTGGDSITLPTPCSFDQLVSAFDTIYERVATVVGDVERVWDQLLPSLTALDQELATVEAQAATQGTRAPNEVAVTRRRIDQLRARAAADPLDLDLDDLEGIRVGVQRARDAVAEEMGAAAHHDELLAHATRALVDLDAGLVEASLMRARAVEKILGAEALPTITAELDLADQLHAERDRLEVIADGGSADNRQLERLVQNCGRLAERVDQLQTTLSASLTQRDELRRRVEGYQAKAQSTGRAEDLVLDRLCRAARDELYVAPCDLDAAMRAVDAYTHAVNRRPAPEDRR